MSASNGQFATLLSFLHPADASHESETQHTGHRDVGVAYLTMPDRRLPQKQAGCICKRCGRSVVTLELGLLYFVQREIIPHTHRSVGSQLPCRIRTR